MLPDDVFISTQTQSLEIIMIDRMQTGEEGDENIEEFCQVCV